MNVAIDMPAVLAAHGRVVAWCSGGKDSLALLHMLRPYATHILVLHNQIDDAWPQVTNNLLTCLDAWGYRHHHITYPSLTLDEYTAWYGHQTEVVPSSMEGTLIPPSPYASGGPKAASWWHCTLVRQLTPLLKATQELGATAVLTGSRASDAPAFAAMGAEKDFGHEAGFVRYNPLYGWTNQDVWAYIDCHAIPLPPHYALWKRRLGERFEASDCQRCTWNPRMWSEVLKPYYPEVYNEHWPQVEGFYSTLAAHLQDGLQHLLPILQGQKG